MVEHDHRHHLEAEFLRGSEPPMPATITPSLPARMVGEAELGDAGGNLRHLRITVRARVACIGHELGGRPSFDLVGEPRERHAATSSIRSPSTSSKV